MNKIPQEAEAYTREHRRKKKWLITMACLAAAVALCTVYALSMPAITMENAQQKLTCPLSVHQHTDECYDENQALICGKADYVVHTHDSSCSGSDGELVCRLSEIPAHEHTADCYSEPEGEDGQRALICEKQELHTHEDSCYDEDGALVCGLLELKEHQHDAGCFQPADGEADSGVAEPEENGDILFASQEDSASSPVVKTGNISDLPGMGIYPAETAESDGTWVVYDAPYEEGEDGTDAPKKANIKATITLQGNQTVTENCHPFIRKVEKGEGFYPDEQALKAAVGDYNDVQCYMIHWVQYDKVKGTYNLDTNMEIGAGKTANIKMEYLKEDARLKGEQGARKLRVFSSNGSSDGTALKEISDSVTDVDLGASNYKGFTFQATKPCPYVFVSKKVEKGYIESLAIKSITDGSAPFDSTGNLGEDGKIDKPGNDANDHNKVVRSYDTILYNLDATFAARQNMVTQREVKMYFELAISKSATAARFDASKMFWLGDNYSIEYLDADDDVVMVKAPDGKFYEPKKNEDKSVFRDENGFAQPDMRKPIQMNAQVNGSTGSGDDGSGDENKYADCYKVSSGGVVRQRMVGWTKISEEEGENVLSGTQTFTAAVEVRNADNGEVFSPTFKMWLDGNEENYGSESTDEDGMVPAKPVAGNFVTAEGDNKVTVSAGTNFNVQLKKNTDMSYKNWFDFSTGEVVNQKDRDRLAELARLEENHGKSNPVQFVDENGNEMDDETKQRYANYRYGRITCYGIALQLYSDTDNRPDENRAAKGMKGISLPVGDITFDLNFHSEAKSNNESFAGSDSEYTAILWDYNENVPSDKSYKYKYVDPGRKELVTPSDGKGNGGRRLYWDGEVRSSYAKGAAPSNYKVYHSGCYYGGDWSMLNKDGQKIDSLEEMQRVADPSVVTGTGKDTTYHFSVSDYDFDFDSQHFPLQDAGNSGNVTGYGTYARCFSAGCVQVLSVFPMVQKQDTAEIYLNTEVSNLHLRTRDGQVLKAGDADETKIGHEVNKKDNTKHDQIVLYAPGNLTKGSSFNGKNKAGEAPKNTSEGYLGTEYWTTSYDCSTFAGDDIWLMGYGMIASGSDYRTRSMNLLQLFDSRALSIRDEPFLNQEVDPDFGDVEGTSSFLYAADPDYPKGYDTNANTADGKTMLSYMNTVREEDLVYSTGKPDKEGYITVNGKRMKCIGVLMELRGCNLLGGKYQYVRIPVKVNGDDKELVTKTVATVNTFRVWSYDLGENITWKNGEWDKTTGKNTLQGYEVPGKESLDEQHERFAGELANNSSPPCYVKTEYENGHQKNGTHVGGTLSGNSLLILSYKAHVNIGVDNKGEGSHIYNQADGQTVVDYRLKEIKTDISDHTGQTDPPKTTLTVRAVLDENNENGKQRISVSHGSYRMEGYEVDVSGKPTGEEKEIAISSDENNPTKLAFKDSKNIFRVISVYAQPSLDGREITFVISEAPVGIQLPDITFQANFAAVTELKNNDTIQTNAYISGSGDNRAYDQAKGNTDNVTVGIVISGGTNLIKAVNTNFIEQDGTITYTVTYANSGEEPVNKVYFYDLLSNNSDIRNSKFNGEIILRSFNLTTEGGGQHASATVYFSTTDYGELYDNVKVFGGEWNKDTGKAQGMDTGNVEKMLNEGTNDKGDHLFYMLGYVNDEGKFQYLDEFQKMEESEISELMESVTGIYVKAEQLTSKQSIQMTFTVETDGNKATNQYNNIANSWIADSKTSPLTSNQVETGVVGRSISGVVWADDNLNGLRDDGELLLKDVTATLFKKDDNTGGYVKCTEDVTYKKPKETKGGTEGGADIVGKSDAETASSEEGKIEPVVTKTDGAYSFDKLAAGDYIVAFSGDALESYTAATVYQHQGATDISNDGVALSELGNVEGIDSDKYAYAIKYSVNSPSMTLNTINEMVKKNIYEQAFEHQDLGLVKASHKLPETGGIGAVWYVLTGAVLVTGAGFLYAARRRKKQKPIR